MKSITSLFICLIIVVFTSNVCGQDPIVRAELCSDTIMVGEQFTLTYIVEGGQLNGVAHDPDLKAFNLLSGPNTSSSMSFINGQMSSKASINFILQGTTPGAYSIEPIALIVNKEEYLLDPLNIVVVENPDGTTFEDLMPNWPSDSIKSKKKRKTYKL